MTDAIVLKLGDFEFTYTEVPEKIPFGVEQATVSHRMPGGKKVVDAMGGYDLPIQWSGEFTGAKALERARKLVRMCKVGQKVELRWSELAYEVVIQRVLADFTRFREIPYEVICEPIRDLASPDAPPEEPDADDAVDADERTAAELCEELNDGVLDEAMAKIEANRARIASYTTLKIGALQTFLEPLQDIQARTAELIGAGNASMIGVATLGDIVTNLPAPTLAKRLLTQVAASADLPDLFDLNAVATRMMTNLETIGESGRVIMSGGEDLFRIAAREYGDPQAWAAIAAANGLVDPAIPGLTELLIPPKAQDTGGVLS